MRPVHTIGRTRGRPGAWWLRKPGADDGMVTAELAMALPALVVVVALLVAVVGAVSDVARASDAARSGARAASIGTGIDEVVAATTRVAPVGAQVAVTSENGWATVAVSPPPVRVGPFSVPLPSVTGAAPLEAALVEVNP